MERAFTLSVHDADLVALTHWMTSNKLINRNWLRPVDIALATVVKAGGPPNAAKKPITDSTNKNALSEVSRVASIDASAAAMVSASKLFRRCRWGCASGYPVNYTVNENGEKASSTQHVRG